MLYYIRKLKEIHSILSINRLWRARLYEIGIIIKDSCLYFGLSGSLSRSIKIIIDARFTGHEFHEELNYSISYPSIGDCLDRYIPRFNEIIESCRIIYGLFYILLSAYFYSTLCSFSIIMELLIEEFLIHFPLILSLILQSKLAIESSKGIYSIYLFPFPFLIINIITNDFPTTNQLNKFNNNINLGDLIAVLGPIDSVLGSVDLSISYLDVLFILLYLFDLVDYWDFSYYDEFELLNPSRTSMYLLDHFSFKLFHEIKVKLAGHFSLLFYTLSIIYSYLNAFRG